MYSAALMKLNLGNWVQFKFKQEASEDQENKQLFFEKCECFWEGSAILGCV